jgi:hypothetical protein
MYYRNFKRRFETPRDYFKRCVGLVNGEVDQLVRNLDNKLPITLRYDLLMDVKDNEDIVITLKRKQTNVLSFAKEEKKEAQSKIDSYVCQLCQINPKDSSEKFHYRGKNVTIVDAKNKKGHNNRLMVFSDAHKINPGDEVVEHGKEMLIETAKKVIGDDFIVYGHMATIQDHWHMIASDMKEDAKDFEEIGKREYVYHRKDKDGKFKSHEEYMNKNPKDLKKLFDNYEW